VSSLAPALRWDQGRRSLADRTMAHRGLRRRAMDERPAQTWRRPLPAGLRPAEGGCC